MTWIYDYNILAHFATYYSSFRRFVGAVGWCPVVKEMVICSNPTWGNKLSFPLKKKS